MSEDFEGLGTAHEEAEWEDDCVLVPPGVYTVQFEREERFLMDRQIWNIRMVIVDDGPHCGKKLPYYLNALKEGRRPRTSKVYKAYVVATGLVPPGHLSRMRPSEFLAECHFTANVVTSTENSDRLENPPALHYSKVDRLIERVAGEPPCLRRRR